MAYLDLDDMEAQQAVTEAIVCCLCRRQPERVGFVRDASRRVMVMNVACHGATSEIEFSDLAVTTSILAPWELVLAVATSRRWFDGPQLVKRAAAAIDGHFGDDHFLRQVQPDVWRLERVIIVEGDLDTVLASVAPECMDDAAQFRSRRRGRP